PYLVPLGVAQDLPAALVVDVVGPGGAQGQGLGGGLGQVAAAQVQVQPVLDRLGLGHAPEVDDQPGGAQGGVAVLGDLHLAAQQPAPPAGQPGGVMAVDGQRGDADDGRCLFAHVSLASSDARSRAQASAPRRRPGPRGGRRPGGGRPRGGARRGGGGGGGGGCGGG